MNPAREFDRRRLLLISATALLAPQIALAARPVPYADTPWRRMTDAQWRQQLSPAAYHVLRREGTEAPGTSPLLNEHRKGTFACAGCALPLFDSSWKFESGTGWPSFYTAIKDALQKKRDFTLGVERTEYHCVRCLGHQGHLFDDGPRPTGLRYCNNGVALKFVPS